MFSQTLSTLSASNGILTITKKSLSYAGYCTQTSFATINKSHKYYISLTGRTDNDEFTISCGFITNNGTVGGNTKIFISSNTFVRSSLIVSPVNDTDIFIIGVGSSNTPIDTVGYVKNVICIDLTQMFGSDAGIVSALGLSNVDEITTSKAVKTFERLFPETYYAH